MNKKWTLELVWWAVTAILVALILLPIYLAIGTDFRFYIENAVFIVLFVTLARWIFLLRHTFFGWHKPTKIVLIFLMIPIFLYCYDALFEFQSYCDEQDIMTMLTKLDTNDQHSFARYIKYEYIFFGTAAIICTILIPFRMIVSLWRQVNKGRV